MPADLTTERPERTFAIIEIAAGYLLDDLITSAKTSEAQRAQVLARDIHHPSTA